MDKKIIDDVVAGLVPEKKIDVQGNFQYPITFLTIETFREAYDGANNHSGVASCNGREIILGIDRPYNL